MSSDTNRDGVDLHSQIDVLKSGISELRRMLRSREPVKSVNARASGQYHDRVELEELSRVRRLHDELTRRCDFEDYLANLAARFLQSEHEQYDELIEQALSAAAKFCGAERIWAYELSADSTQAKVKSLYYEPGFSGVSSKQREFHPIDEIQSDWLIPKMLAGESVVLRRLSELPTDATLDRQLLESQDVKSTLYICMKRREQVLGFVRVDAVSGERDWPAEFITQIELFAQVIAASICCYLANEKLTRNMQRYRAIVEDQTELIVRWDPNGMRTFVNQAYCRFFGITPEQAANTSFLNLVHPADRESVQRKVASLSVAQPVAVDEHRVLRPDGTTGWMQWIDRAIYDEHQRLTEYQSVGRDITSQKRMEEELAENRAALAHVARLSTMSEMVAGIAHETLQPLTSIQTLSLAMSKVLTSGGEFDKQMLLHWTNSIRQSVRLADQIIRRLRSFVEKRQTLKHMETLHLVIEDAIQLLNYELRHAGIKVELRLPPEPVRVLIDRIQMEQVVINLIKNSCDAIASEPEASSKTVVVAMEVQDENIEFVVSDQGPGISESHRGRLFKPFETTKANGMGLGLAISRTIIEMHEGDIWFTPNYPRGSRFHVRLPKGDSANSVSHQIPAIEFAKSDEAGSMPT